MISVFGSKMINWMDWLSSRSSPMGSSKLLRPEVDIHILLPPLDVEGIVGDGPPILDQGILDLVVIPVARGHGETPSGPYSGKK
jgi:hypothetical protein